MKCISLPPNKLPRVLVSLGRMISVISDCESATSFEGAMAISGALIPCLLRSFSTGHPKTLPAATMNPRGIIGGTLFKFQQSLQFTQIPIGDPTPHEHHRQTRRFKRDPCLGSEK